MIVCGFTSLDRRTLDRVRNELKQKGYIDYKQGKGNQAGKYLLVQFDTQYDTQCDTQYDTQCDTQCGTQMSHNVTTLNKQNINKTKHKKVSKKENYDDVVLQFNLSDEIEKAVRDFIAMRTMIKKPMTNKALELMLKKLLAMSDSEEIQKKILEQSIMNNWQGIYPLKEDIKQMESGKEQKKTRKYYKDYTNLPWNDQHPLYDWAYPDGGYKEALKLMQGDGYYEI